MTDTAFRQAWAGKLAGRANNACYYLRPRGSKPGVDILLMFEHGQFVRYDVRTPAIVAPGGIKVGTPATQARADYPGIEQQPDKYDADAYYLRVANPAGQGVLIFHIGESGTVTQWRAGILPQVDYVEGCA